MSFENILSGLNKKGWLLDGLSQIEDGKKWSARVRKQKTTNVGYGTGRTIDAAVKKAMSVARDSFDPKGFSKLDAPINPPEKKKRRRVRVRKK